MNTLKGKTILIVDDDERNCFAMSSYLDLFDVNVLTAGNGSEALRLLDTEPFVHMIILDIMMPVMDGFDMLRMLKDHQTYKTIPVIAVTALAMKGDKEKCLEAGAWDYFPKPIDIKSFIGKISTLV